MRNNVLISGVAGALIAFVLLSAMPVGASTVLNPGWKWCSDPRVWNDVADADYRLTSDVAVALWNGAPFARKMQPGTSSNWQIYVGQHSDSTTDAYAIGAPTEFDAYPCIKKGKVSYNLYYAKWKHGTIRQHMYRSTHEFGHALNLGHYQLTTADDIMYPDTSPQYLNNILAPTKDAIGGLQGMYGLSISSFPGRAIVGSAAITPAYPSAPTRMTTGVGVGTNYAMAYDSYSATSSQRGMFASAIVKPNDLYRYGLGFYGSTNPTNLNDRMVTAELDSDGLKAVVTKPGGGITVLTMADSATLQVGYSYFLTAAMYRVGPSNTYYANVCAWEIDRNIFLTCKDFSETQLAFGNPPATIRGGEAVWSSTVGELNDYSPQWAKTGVY